VAPPSPLAGRTIAITRPESRSGPLARRLAAVGASVLARPLIEIAEPESWAPLDEAIGRIGEFHWIVFTSVNGAAAFARRLRERGRSAADAGGARVAAVGRATAARLREEGLKVDLVAGTPDAEGLAADLPLASMAGLKVLLPGAAEGRDILPRALVGAGALTTQAECYRTLQRSGEGLRLAREVLAGSVDALLFASPSAVRCLSEALDSLQEPAPDRVGAACIGPVTARAARAAGWQRVAVCSSPSDAAAASALESLLAG